MDLTKGVTRLDETTSTNDVCLAEARRGAAAWRVWVAEKQTGGRGRLNRVWSSPAGQGLWFSVLLRPTLPPASMGWLPLCAAMAMRDALLALTGTSVGVKWPNDLVSDGKKLCGILMESILMESVLTESVLTESVLTPNPTERIHTESTRTDSLRTRGVLTENAPVAPALLRPAVAVGVGLNLYPGAFPPELGDRATCLETVAGRVPDRDALLASFLRALKQGTDTLEKDGPEALLPEFRFACVTLGRPVQVSGAVSLTGIAREVLPDGALAVETPDGVVHTVYSGDVSVRGLMGYS